MPERERLTKKFAVYRTTIDDEPAFVEAEYDTVDQVRHHQWRLDRQYKVRVGVEFMTPSQFYAWAESRSS